MNKNKRFVPIKTYCEMSGLSYATVSHMLNSGQLQYITTESGQRRVDTQGDSKDEAAMHSRLNSIESAVKALCRQFNIDL